MSGTDTRRDGIGGGFGTLMVEPWIRLRLVGCMGSAMDLEIVFDGGWDGLGK